MLPNMLAFAAFLLAQAAGEDGVVMPVYQSCAEAFADNEWLSSNSRSFYISNPTLMSSLRNERSNVTRCVHAGQSVRTRDLTTLQSSNHTYENRMPSSVLRLACPLSHHFYMCSSLLSLPFFFKIKNNCVIFFPVVIIAARSVPEHKITVKCFTPFPPGIH